MERRRKLATLESIEYRRLLGIIRRVRNRWRLRVLLRGIALALVSAATIVLPASWGLDAFRYRPWAVIGLSAVTYSVLAYGIYRFLVRPLWRRVTDEQVALYVQERTDVDAALVSAVQFGSPERRRDHGDVSPQLVEKLVEQVVQRGPEIHFGKSVETGELRRVSGVLGAASMAVVAVALMNPAFLLDGARRLFAPFARTAAVAPYTIEVSPGSGELARGGDQLIAASLFGFDSDQVEISFKIGEDDWERQAMTADTVTGAYQFIMFRLSEDAEYFVEASGVRSPLYRLEVVDVPYVERIDLELVFPEYSDLSPQVIEDGGDIAALLGTRARLRITPTVAVPAGSLRIEWLGDGDGDEPLVETVPLESGQEEEGLSVELEILRSGYYRVELSDFDGTLYEASSEYLIEVLDDQPPIVAFDTPGRDVTVTSIEEVFTEVSAEDDYGLARVDLIYSINGGERRTVPLLNSAGADRRRLTAAHTFYLEEEELVPGDFIVYFARAEDNRSVGDTQPRSTDLYFLEVQPFDRRYQQADAGGGGGGGGGQGGGLGLARRQREVVSATFKIARDADTLADDEMSDDLEFLAEVENDLRESVQEVQGQFGGLQSDEDSLRGIDYLAEASKALGEAAGELSEHDADGALPPEQRALQNLQRFEALFLDMQVSMNQGGGGGGGSAGDMAELEEMFENQLDELDNQYESVRRERQEETDNAVDEAMQRLTELARRQQQEIERQRAQSARSSNQGGGAAQQREIAEQAEELARELERLGRRNSQRDLQEAANRLREAADAMRRAAADGGDAGASESARALNDLQNARRLLDRDREGRLDRDLRDAQQRIAEMREDQSAIERGVESMGRAGRTPERIDDLFDRKDRLTEEIRGLERDLDDMARESRGEQMAASRALQEAAEWVRDEKLADKVRYSKGVVQERDPRTAQAFEGEISDDMASLEGLIDTAAGSVEQSPGERLADAVDDTRDLIRRLESFEDRVRDAAEGERPGQQGSEPGQEGSESGAQGDQGGQPADGRAGDRGQSRLGGSSSGVPGARQFGREFRERVADAEELLDRLGAEGLQTTDLDAVVDAMRDFEEQFQGTTRGLDELSSDVIDGLKLFEFWLRRLSEAEAGVQPQLAGADRVPEEYRSLVEEYFRSLAREDSR